MRNMKFVSLYKGITLTVQGKCVKCICTRLLIGFVQFLNNFEFDIKIIDSSFFFFYQTMSLRHSLQKLTHRK